MPPAVETLALVKRFGSHIALADASFQVEAGEFLTLLGPSGCGKTTLLRLIAGLDRPDAGRIRLAGQDVTDQPAYRRPVHTVFQSYALFPHLNAYDNIAFGLTRQRRSPAVIRQRVEAMLALVGLEGERWRYPHELSGGQQQRVALARALACEPPVLLLDEPLAALDPRLRQRMQRELKSLQHQLGTTFIFVTHDQTEALTLSDRIAVLHNGRIVQTGPPQKLHAEPETAFVASFIGNCNLLKGEARSRQSEMATVVIAGRLAPALWRQDGAAAGQPVVIAVRPEGVQLESASGDNASGLTGRIVERLYVGADTRWTVRLPDGQTLVAALRHEPSRAWEIGALVQVSWQPAAAVIVTPDEVGDETESAADAEREELLGQGRQLE
ncbi:MAG: spermidine/putrescine ABC transporter ATP-binding protein [Chloracidobacterium sp. CP2_5A]|nr:MAG: spermidine/putrescine ABC transporter ATP-binding protein [Chloracidobacterium sp. CP2_5A]